MSELYRAQAIVQARDISYEAFQTSSYEYGLYFIVYGIALTFDDFKPMVDLFDRSNLLDTDDVNDDRHDSGDEHENRNNK